ncbi:bifunctional tRNA (5-methylaminomethyl-2-thiouridine)(34)-methyltransferase MnmD/FAD-dependent 5-carboxymethylaminomethyl-2-thiouridine(34) oxidoreductase MnmC [Catenovulum adriaticum]|uniref:tRNA 5-methylaminomethyl-2-thiouridine biosynthesis bifunctional protein MnmC n=1 Tax=Catenovulum adriaticum TaxID=2984846 RepID=A0ABY7AJI5_9ALTE|nr:bifunctional tRNA (5-methylaminomethyl-2-thiouridine)(34)-methyltransferase MnmD/FAD-dependent 5-carboxymethylaminomethyl-2-thiouridine(34) oxidoreductase MnmC [Catenovulum sp. TS8]WAJ69276.1 bifunctional tRNA (5-methylaminomethyl-2-thiouridine)(34)-methyltransferase MnmD/FAD-dependent 5-carboxymethylaminomethyl-2-thiouridine(34) oxidoreductase MnmC [Catenovulum sp. TS8]
MTKIHTASVEFNQNGTPVSTKFDDVYFSTDDGLAESRYVFQQGNKLNDRWQTWPYHHFTIAETGFGTGLNFLAVCQAFTQFKQQNPNSPLKQLNFISFEKYPLCKTDLAKALAPWQMLSCWSEQLIQNYPYLVEGIHRIEFDSQIKLDLWFGDIHTQLPQVADNQTGIVDAWFLDGFAPSKNQAMWHQNIFNHMARLASKNGHFATFTAAGFVKRGLVEAGFVVNKQKGFGRKREMLLGHKLQINTNESSISHRNKNRQNKTTTADPHSNKVAQTKLKQSLQPTPYPQMPAKSKQTCIIGGGIAAICTALTLAERGHHIHLICQSHLADGASGNRQGAIYPLVQNELNRVTDCHLKSYQYACQFYQKWRRRFEFSVDFCGVVQLAFSEKMQKRQQALLANPSLPNELFDHVKQQEMESVTGINFPHNGLYFPQGGWLNPTSFIKAAVKYLQQTQQLTLSTHTQLIYLNRQQNNWRLTCQTTHDKPETQVFEADNVVLAQGWQVSHLPQTTHLAIKPSRGQVSYLQSNKTLNQLTKVICHKGYLTPQWQNLHSVGATFKIDQTDAKISEEDDNANLEMHQTHTPNITGWLTDKNVDSSRASIRATTEDRLPMIGNVSPIESLQTELNGFAKGGRLPQQPISIYPNLYVIAGLGSRGLTNTPLMAESLAAIMQNESIPLSLDTITAVHPNRFAIRTMKRGKL